MKANSEGQPGPQDYHRTHADGANMLADALAPHHGMVMWRAFVYSADVNEDRAKQAYDEFVPLDGKFRANVLLQAKNGPIDFQPREPFHPIFGAMPHTPQMLELQITKEYLGLATSLVYLGPLFEEALRVGHLCERRRFDGREGDRWHHWMVKPKRAWRALRMSVQTATGPARSSIRRTGTLRPARLDPDISARAIAANGCG